MTFTPNDRDDIMGFLGIPVTEEQVNYVQGILTAVEVYPDAVSRIRAYLSKLAAIDSQIETARNVGSKMPYEQLLSEGDRYVRLLSASLDIDVKEWIYRNG